MNVLGACVALIVATSISGEAPEDGGIVYTDISPGTPLESFSRVGSTTVAEVEAMFQQALNRPITFDDIMTGPMMPRGLPGVAVFDYDRDGDLDLYITNGPGAANSLFQSQLSDSGTVSFVDVGLAAGVDATSQDSFGTCFGDIDNDGDHDLMVLGRNEANRLYENNGDGTFTQLTSAGVDGGTLSSTNCSMLDIDNDGHLDIVVANSFDQGDTIAILSEPYELNQPNQLLRNNGDKSFIDVSDSSGIRENQGYPPGASGITWSVGTADVDHDGDSDVVFMDDQGGIPAKRHGGLDRGYIHVFLNNGMGQFTDNAIIQNEYSASEWMGVSFGDLNCDGKLDLFASSFGDYDNQVLDLPYFKGGSASRPFFGNGDGTFVDSGPPIPSVNGTYTTTGESTAFGWGCAIFDADNDGDSDILYHGGLDVNIVVLADNPGVLLLNDGQCSGKFKYDPGAITTDHTPRNVRGVAVGDLDGDGFVDVATVANLRTPPQLPLVPVPEKYGDPLDSSAFFVPITSPNQDGEFVFNGQENLNGDFKVELASGNGNNHVTIELAGSFGMTPGGQVNRDGIGALVSFTPSRGKTSIQAIVGGSSHSSQHSLRKVFGLGSKRSGTLEVLWPGGVRNRLYGVRKGTHVVMPEIPCSYDADWKSSRKYRKCVKSALRDLRRLGAISRPMGNRLLRSAILAYRKG